MLRTKPKKGMVLFIVLAFTCILTIIAFATLSIATGEITLTQQYIEKTKAFYLAEAALAKFSANTSSDIFASIDETSLGSGTYEVDYHSDGTPPYAVASGSAGGAEKKLKVSLSFLAPPYECSAYAGNMDGTEWALVLRGTGNPTIVPGEGDYGGKDVINGNLFAGGDVHLYEESSVNPPLDPNPFGLNGDVEATGTIDVHDIASISGDELEGVDPYNQPDLIGMNYAVNHTHNVSQIFVDEGISSGYLPVGHELRDIFVKNPSNKSAECDSTTVDDFFFEPSSGFVIGTPFTGETPINAGEDRVYYIDGDLWVSGGWKTFGFEMEGKSTIVVTGNIHICDNLEYADDDSILGLVALGKYDEEGDLVSGGNVYFGDPVMGNMAMFSSMMFAANDFLYNTDPITYSSAEPLSGFTLNGSLIALNQVQIERDWYTVSEYWNGYKWVEERGPCRYNPDTSQWLDSETDAVLDQDQIDSITHYRMVINYDDRVRSSQTQPLGLPRGEGTIFDGLRDWEEYSE